MSKTEAQATIFKALEDLACVERLVAWNDRHYVNLVAARNSRANADLRTKIWLRGDVLTVEAGKGYHSNDFIAAKASVVAVVAAAGGTVRAI